MQDDISGWDEWNAAFSNIEELSSPSELHGILTGIVCVTLPPTSAQWIAILDTLHIPPLNDAALALLTEETEDVAAILKEDDLDYFPMIPDDSHNLYQRYLALCDWCSGVVLGFSLASGFIRSDEKELIELLQEMAATGLTEEDAAETDEQDFSELYEFYRLAPVSLSTGRKKVEVLTTSLLKGSRFTSTTTDIVEVFTPHRPS